MQAGVGWSARGRHWLHAAVLKAAEVVGEVHDGLRQLGAPPLPWGGELRQGSHRCTVPACPRESPSQRHLGQLGAQGCSTMPAPLFLLHLL